MLVQVIIILICHLVEPKPIDDNKLDDAKSQFLEENQSSYICELSPFSDEGHYFLPNDPERSNIIDGQPGIKLHLIIRLINARTCEPLKGVYVHIWHANAKGKYSGIESSHQKSSVLLNNTRKPTSLNVGEKGTEDSFDESRVYQKTRDTETKLTPELHPSNHASNPENLNSKSKLNLKKRSAAPASITSQNFLRGYQMSNYAGEASFTTIIPGWYKGRTQHIHIEVYPDESTSRPIYIGQLFFDNLSYLSQEKEYQSNDRLIVANQDDGIYANFEGVRTTISMADIGPNMQGIITLGVDPEMIKIFDLESDLY